MDAASRRFAGRDPGGALGMCRVPARSLGQRDREQRLVPVDDVHPQEKGDTEATLFDGDALKLAGTLDVFDVEQRPDAAGCDQLFVVRLLRVGARHEPGHELIQLSDLFFDGHPVDQVPDAPFYLVVPIGDVSGKISCISCRAEAD